MQRLLLLVVIVLLLGVSIRIVNGNKKKSTAVTKTPKTKTAAIPRSKSARRTVFTPTFGSGFFHRVIRDIKGSFSSELESITLQLTRPVDIIVPSKPLEDFVVVVAEEYQDPLFLTSTLIKLSRKLMETNIYTKMKALYALHRLMSLSADETQVAIAKCINGIRGEKDGKLNEEFFSMESILELEDSAVNVAELANAEFTKQYAIYVLDYIDVKGSRSSLRENVLDRTDMILKVLNQGFIVEDKCVKTLGVVANQCLDAVLEERRWLLKQLSKLYEIGIPDEELQEDVLKLLIDADIKVAPRIKEAPTKKASKTSSNPQGKQSASASLPVFSLPDDEEEDNYPIIVEPVIEARTERIDVEVALKAAASITEDSSETADQPSASLTSLMTGAEIDPSVSAPIKKKSTKKSSKKSSSKKLSTDTTRSDKY